MTEQLVEVSRLPGLRHPHSDKVEGNGTRWLGVEPRWGARNEADSTTPLFSVKGHVPRTSKASFPHRQHGDQDVTPQQEGMTWRFSSLFALHKHNCTSAQLSVTVCP